MLKAYLYDRLFYFTETRKNYVKVLVYIWCMKKVTLGGIAAGSGFRFGGVLFRVSHVYDKDEELILCQIAAQPGSIRQVELNGVILNTPVDFWDAYVYIANHTLVDIAV